MRLILSTLVAFICFCVPVNAQNASTQNAAEGTGLITSDSDGALPKGLWRNNPRSEINYLLKNLPAEAPFKSMQEIKRNMLISAYDTSEIINDVEIAVGEDLLTLRLEKLLELGLWDDAYALYTKTTSDPGQNGSLARIGILLSLYKNGIANACLDAKAFGPRFSGDFWSQIDLICDAEIYNETIISTQFPTSMPLKQIYTLDNYKISANNLKTLSILELMMAQLKGKISYDGFLLSPNTPPLLLRVFLNDSKFPSKEKTALESLSKQKLVLLENDKKKQDSNENTNIDNQLSNDIPQDEEKSLLSRVAFHVENNQQIAPNLAQDLKQKTLQNKQNILFYQLVNRFGLIESNQEFSKDELQLSVSSFDNKYKKEVRILKSWLDNSPEFSNNPIKVYEKQINLPKSGDLSPYSEDWTEWLGKTTSQQLAGLSLLIVLNNNKNIGERSEKILNDLNHVGLIEQSHQIARDMTARLMRITN